MENETISDMDALVIENLQLQAQVNQLTAQLHSMQMRERYGLKPGDKLDGTRIVRAKAEEAAKE